MSAKANISKIVEKWYLLEPLYFAVWTLHKVEPSIHIKTIKVHSGHIEYNPVFIEELSTQELNEVLCFEAMRIVLKHPYRRKKDDAKIAYQASNITIQEYTKSATLNFPYAKDYFQTHDFDKKHFEFYYDKIIELAEKSLDEDDGEDGNKLDGEDGEGQAPNSGQGGENGEIGDGGEKNNQAENSLSEYTDPSKTGYENANDWDKNEYEEQLINDKIKEVQISNSWGSITGSIQEEILATLKPKVNYRTILKSFRASVLSNTRRLTRMKPSRRYGFLYMGSRRDWTTKLLFAVDISGSVDSYALKNAFSILNRFFKYGIEEISTICFDSEIKSKVVTLQKAKKEVKICGRGGTNFNAVIDYIDKNPGYDGVIIFTDGYAPCPKPPKNRKTRILWLFDSEQNYKNCKDDLSKLGKVAFVKES